MLQAIRAIAIYYPRCLRLIYEAGRFHAIAAFSMNIVSALVPAGQVWLTKMAIDAVLASLSSAEAGQPDLMRALMPIGGVLGLWLVGGLCGSAANALQEQVGMLVRHHSQYLVLHKATQLDIAFFETPGFFDEMQKAREGYRAHNLAVLSVSIAASAFSLAALAGLLMTVHWLAVVVLLVTAAPQVVAGGHFAGKRFTLVGAMARNERMAHYVSHLLDSRESVKEVRIFGLEKEFLRRFSTFWESYRSEVGKLRLKQEGAGFLLSLLAMLGTIGIWAYAVLRAVGGHISVGTVALAFQSSEQARSGLSRFFNDLGLFYEHTIFAGNLLRFLDLKSSAVEGALRSPPANPVPFPRQIQQGIEFRNVSFHYPQSDVLVLKDVSFIINAETSLAIVGENGAGKTTLVKLMCRLYDPTEGEILVDGIDLREFDLNDLRRSVGIIFQDFVRYHLPVKENIGLGQLDKIDDLSRIRDAADAGGALALIEQLPTGFDTVLGKEFDDGAELSGGQWQKIALSRAFMRDSQVLILDEPTAALDPLAEHDVFERFQRLASGRIAIFISHRFSTVRMANQILVIDEGQVTELDSHEELLRRNGKYAKMFNTQAERYR